jgi:hypothetical protein
VGLALLKVALLETTAGTLLSALGPVHVNLRRRLDGFGQDGDRVLYDFQKPAARRKDDSAAPVGVLVGRLGLYDEGPDAEGRNHGRVIRAHLEGALHARGPHAIRGALKCTPVGGDDVNGQFVGHLLGFSDAWLMFFL